MKYTNEQIKEVIEDFIKETEQPEIRYVISYCIGYFGYLTKQIWTVIQEVVYKPH